MKFCPKCGGILVAEEGKMRCDCGYVSDEETLLTEKKEEGGAPEVEEEKEVDVIERTIESPLPETKAKCPKCDHDVAYYWNVQTRAADEPETTFFECKKCKHRWRHY